MYEFNVVLTLADQVETKAVAAEARAILQRVVAGLRDSNGGNGA